MLFVIILGVLEYCRSALRYSSNYFCSLLAFVIVVYVIVACEAAAERAVVVAVAGTGAAFNF